MSSADRRLDDLRAAERDYQFRISEAYGAKRLELVGKLNRIRRQIAMMTECDRAPAAMPVQHRRFK